MSENKIYLDCDPGIDDALALGYLLGAPGVDLLGIGTVSGNTDALQGARNALSLLELAGRTDVPVAIGSNDFSHGNYDGGAPHVHGERGTGTVDLAEATTQPVVESAVEMMIRLSHQHQGELHIVAVGPLTNLARALERDPSITRRVKQVTIMGGAALVPGNVTQAAEANIKNDPEAARTVFNAPWTIVVVPLDVTLFNTFEESDREALMAGSPFAQALGAMLDYYFNFYVGFFGRRAAALHDPLAAAVAVGGVKTVVAPRCRITVDCGSSATRGQTRTSMAEGLPIHQIPDTPGAHISVVLRTDESLPTALREALLAI